MATSLDLTLDPIAKFAGEDHFEALGLHAAEPPKRAARGKGKDRLVLYLAVTGNALIPPAKQKRLLTDLAGLYYETAGSVTSGLRAVADALNESLLDRNLRISNSGRLGIGLFTQFVLREDQVYLAMSGPIHAYLIAADGVQHFYTADMESRGLGQGRTPPISFHQARLHANDTLLFAAQPGPEWNVSSLSGLHGQGPQSVRRKLFSQVTDVNAVLIQARTGRGKYYLPRPQPAAPGPAPRADAVADLGDPGMPPVKPAAQPAVEIAPPEPGWQDALAVAGSVSSGTATAGPSGAGPLPAEDEIETGAFEFPTADPAGVGTREPTPARPRLDLTAFWKALAVVGLPILNALQKLGRGVGALFERLIPEELSSAVMMLIALAVPVVVVAVAGVVYNKLGVSAQYEALYAQLEQKAAEARNQTDSQSRRNSWGQVLFLLAEVEDYKKTPETIALREQALQVLDELDLVKRVDYQPAIAGQLPTEVSISRIVVAEEDLYLLDGNSGNVIRAVPTEQGYVLYSTFQCGPGPIGVSEAGMLIDIIPWPGGFVPDASVLALDDSGNVVYCLPGEAPQIDKLAVSSSQSSGEATGLTLDMSDLYVLDPSANAVWIYWGSDVQDEPTLFFDQEIPPLEDVIDLTANNKELYLLHANGQTTLCYLGTTGVSPTRCSDPPYVDDRTGLEGTPLESPSPFTQILFTPPPDPSLYLMEPKSHSIYHFSLRNLVYKRQLLPKEPLPTRPATAFFVDVSKRMLYLAIGNEIYYGIIP